MFVREEGIGKMSQSDKKIIIKNESNIVESEHQHCSELYFGKSINDFDPSIYYISDIHLEHHFKSNDKKDIKKEIENIVQNLFQDFDYLDFHHNASIIFLGDICGSIKIARIFYEYFAKYYAEKCKYCNVFVILGNHELSEFDTYEDGCVAYQQLFAEIKGIYGGAFFKLLNCSGCIISRQKYLLNKYDTFENAKKNNPASWEYNKGYAIIGMPGFAQYNNEYNANNLCNARDIDRNKEIDLSSYFEQQYLKAVQNSIDSDDRLLVVCSHYPIKDWIAKENLNKRCIYIAGHDHRNKVLDVNGCTIYEDGQIGYSNNHICFKHICVNGHFDPFLDLNDGIYEIPLYDYVRFCGHSNIYVSGYGVIRRHINNYGKKFYLIKRDKYHLFLLQNDKKTSIVYKGRVNNTQHKSLSYFYDNFLKIIDDVNTVYVPFREKLDMLSKSIKEISPYEGGKIHGCIIDIDFLNHVMVNPIDGKLTFYYSEFYGQIVEHKSLQSLLKGVKGLVHKRDTLSRWKKEQHPLMQVYDEAEEKSMFVDVGQGTMYEISRKMLMLQFLYETGILGIWYDTKKSDIAKLYDRDDGIRKLES